MTGTATITAVTLGKPSVSSAAKVSGSAVGR
jgi:hypothetical protein